MTTELARLLPRPGPVWGAYPLRGADDTAPPRRRTNLSSLVTSPLAAAQATASASFAHMQAWQALDATARTTHLTALRVGLRRDGLTAALQAQAIGVAAACASEVLGQTPRMTQCTAAAALLDQRLAEMDTGEGKTLALALAAAVAALAGIPVHVVTANDYLAARDAHTLAPFYAALGLRTAALPVGPGHDEAKRRAAYAHDVLYATARDLAFDHLRDRLAFGSSDPMERVAQELTGAAAPQPLMRGLCMALLDEADSILLDEAEVPLVLSRQAPNAARRAFLWQALAVARRLETERDFTIEPTEQRVHLTTAGAERVAALAAPLGGPWRRLRYRHDAIVIALTGLHARHRDAHYIVRNGAIELIDEITGRVAAGRVWSRGLQTVVALKEGLAPPAETDTLTQITFQRFFQRYWRIAGLSGTLAEAGAELRDVVGARVVRIPRHTATRLLRLPPRVFAHAHERRAAVCARVAELQAAGRPVLLGTDSVAESQALSEQLHAAGIAHRVLNALHDADEAAIVAEAGQAGRVTVATRMAGRGTDIRLDAAALAAGGLHVLSCQDNASHRLDRQIAGRAARHGDPGSAEAWLLRRFSSASSTSVPGSLLGWTSFHSTRRAWLALASRRCRQWFTERRRATCRAELLRSDRHWERRLSFAGPSR